MSADTAKRIREQAAKALRASEKLARAAKQARRQHEALIRLAEAHERWRVEPVPREVEQRVWVKRNPEGRIISVQPMGPPEDLLGGIY